MLTCRGISGECPMGKSRGKCERVGECQRRNNWARTFSGNMRREVLWEIPVSRAITSINQSINQSIYLSKCKTNTYSMYGL